MNRNSRGNSIPARGRGRGGYNGPARALQVLNPSKKKEKTSCEMLMKRFSNLNPDQVRISRTKDGTELEEILVGDVWITSWVASQRLAHKQAELVWEIAANRSQARLGRVLTVSQLKELGENHQEVKLLMKSQKEYQFFLAARGQNPGPALQQGANQVGADPQNGSSIRPFKPDTPDASAGTGSGSDQKQS